MRLKNVSPEFAELEINPEQDYNRLKHLYTSVQHQLELAQEKENKIKEKLGEKDYVSLGFQTLEVGKPGDDEQIAKHLENGQVPVYHHNQWHKQRLIDAFYISHDANEGLLKQFTYAQQQRMAFEDRFRELDHEIKRAKTRWDSWKRKQPEFMSRERLNVRGTKLAEKIIAEVKEKLGIELTLVKVGTWKAKARCAIILKLQKIAPGSTTVWDTAKEKLVPFIDKYLTDQGYTENYNKKDYISPMETHLKLFPLQQQVFDKNT